VYQLFPPYNLGRGLANLASLDLESTLRGRASNPYLWDVTGRALALMLLEAAVFVTLTLLIDSGSLLPCWLSFGADPVPTSYMHSGMESSLGHASHHTTLSMEFSLTTVKMKVGNQ
jgi:hypothetical protein